MRNRTGYHFFDGKEVVERDDEGGTPIDLEGLKALKQLGLEAEKVQIFAKEMKITIKESAKAF